MNGGRLKARHLLLLPCLLIFAGYAYAGIYKWKDAEGTLHFSNAPAPSHETQSNPASGAGHDGRNSSEGLSSQLLEQQRIQKEAEQEAKQEADQLGEQDDTQQAAQPGAQQAAQQGHQQKKVVMYSTSWCVFCKQARAHFDQKGIQYTDYDIEHDPDAAQRYRQMHARGVPLIFVGKTRIDGWNAQDFDRIYYHGNAADDGPPLAIRAIRKLQQFTHAIDRYLSGSTQPH